MTRVLTSDMDNLSARLHGLRSEMIEFERLSQMSEVPSISELARRLGLEEEVRSGSDFQRRILKNFADELQLLRENVKSHRICFLEWFMVRLQLEDLKVMLRGFIKKIPLEALIRQLSVTIPPSDWSILDSAPTLEQFAQSLPGPLSESLQRAVVAYRDNTFFVEAALDRDYFQELLCRCAKLATRENESIAPIIWQEVDIFHWMLVIRGRFTYAMGVDDLARFHVSGTRIDRRLYMEMLREKSLSAVARHGIGRVIDPLPKGSEAELKSGNLEILAWRRFRRLANQAFRHDAIGFGIVAGYATLRRIEVMNLVTISEGIRAKVPPDGIRARLVSTWEEDARV